jgi:hydrogenase maturation protease
MGDPIVLILGVGNMLMQDDGIGVWAVRALNDAYDIPANVRIVDGGVGGLGLLGEVGQAAFLLVIDAVKCGDVPGSIHRLEPEMFPSRQGPFFSAHEVGIAELLSTAEFTGKLPKTRIIGVEPLETETVGLELPEPLRAALASVVAAVVEELRRIGLELRGKEESESRR